MRALLALLAAVALSGCASVYPVQYDEEEATQISGPATTRNYTPYSPALMCIAMVNEQLPAAMAQSGPIAVATGEFPDLSNRWSNYDGGGRVPLSGPHMVAHAVNYVSLLDLKERLDLSVYKMELATANEKLLGDGEATTVNGQPVNWRVLEAGSVEGTDYYISGAITEINESVASGGAALGINGVGAGARQFTMTIAADFRVVNTRTLDVVFATSVRKQVTGFETKAGIFTFFGSTNVNFDAGSRHLEPLHLAVRAVIERGVAEAAGAILGDSDRAQECIEAAEAAYYTDPLKVYQLPGLLAREIADKIVAPAPTEPEPVVN